MHKGRKVSLARLLTVAQLAEALGLQRWRIYELCARGEGPPFLKIGKTLRFSEAAVAQWIEARSAQHHPVNTDVAT